jgi:hypothetical protein
MDGYIITATAEQAIAAFGEPGVRHVAELESGEGFVAFEGDRPCAGALLLNAPDTDQDGWWYRVRKGIASGPEGFYLLTRERFKEFLTTRPSDPRAPVRILEPLVAASVLTTGNVLVMTNGEAIEGAIWGSKATSYRDTRVEAALA